ncbi:MAG: molybdenum cofactor biosynthesis protein MoaE [Pseudomonadota bacterium]
MAEIVVQVDKTTPVISDLSELLSAAQDAATGAVATFTGVCRDEGGKLEALELHHYPGMAEKQLEAIAQKALADTGATALAIHHRHGLVPAGEAIVAVIAASAHRKASLEAVGFVMDFLKTDAPFWKREIWKNGETRWVEAKQSDDEARALRVLQS